MNRLSLSKLGGAAVVLAILAAALILVFGAKGSGNNPLKIEVFAKQYSWSFGYPAQDNAFARNEVHVPVGQQIEFEMHSDDVIHAFWVPEWKIKVDVPPAQIEMADVTPEKTGTFQLICAQSCGIDHYAMRAKVVVEPPKQFRRWLSGLGAVPAHLRELARLDQELKSIREASGN